MYNRFADLKPETRPVNDSCNGLCIQFIMYAFQCVRIMSHDKYVSVYFQISSLGQLCSFCVVKNSSEGSNPDH